MIERFDGGSSKVKNMIDIQFQQSATQDKASKLDNSRILYGCCVISTFLFTFHLVIKLTGDKIQRSYCYKK